MSLGPASRNWTLEMWRRPESLDVATDGEIVS